MTDAESLQLGPSQREVYRILVEDGGKLRSGQIAERADRMTDRAVRRALDRLQEDDLVEVHEVETHRGWHRYSAVNRGE